MAKITEEEIRKIAKLAHLELTDDEVKMYQNDLSWILWHIESLSNINTDWVEPIYQVTWLQNITRKDEVKSSWIEKELIDCAKNKTANWSILVKNVL